MTTGRVNPQFHLEDQGIEGLGNVYYNQMEPVLIESCCKAWRRYIGQRRDFSGDNRQVHGALTKRQARRHD